MPTTNEKFTAYFRDRLAYEDAAAPVNSHVNTNVDSFFASLSCTTSNGVTSCPYTGAPSPTAIAFAATAMGRYQNKRGTQDKVLQHLGQLIAYVAYNISDADLPALPSGSNNVIGDSGDVKGGMVCALVEVVREQLNCE